MMHCTTSGSGSHSVSVPLCRTRPLVKLRSEQLPPSRRLRGHALLFISQHGFWLAVCASCLHQTRGPQAFRVSALSKELLRSPAEVLSMCSTNALWYMDCN